MSPPRPSRSFRPYHRALLFLTRFRKPRARRRTRRVSGPITGLFYFLLIAVMVMVTILSLVVSGPNTGLFYFLQAIYKNRVYVDHKVSGPNTGLFYFLHDGTSQRVLGDPRVSGPRVAPCQGYHRALLFLTLACHSEVAVTCVNGFQALAQHPVKGITGLFYFLLVSIFTGYIALYPYFVSGPRVAPCQGYHRALLFLTMMSLVLSACSPYVSGPITGLFYFLLDVTPMSSSNAFGFRPYHRALLFLTQHPGHAGGPPPNRFRPYHRALLFLTVMLPNVKFCPECGAFQALAQHPVKGITGLFYFLLATCKVGIWQIDWEDRFRPYHRALLFLTCKDRERYAHAGRSAVSGPITGLFYFLL
jgi:hypothetical protein